MFRQAREIWDFLADTNRVAWGVTPARSLGLDAPTTLPALQILPRSYTPHEVLEIGEEGAFSYEIKMIVRATDRQGIEYHAEPDNPDSIIAGAFDLQRRGLSCASVMISGEISIFEDSYLMGGSGVGVWVLNIPIQTTTLRQIAGIVVPTITGRVEETLMVAEGPQARTRIGRISWQVAGQDLTPSEIIRLREAVVITSNIDGITIDTQGDVFYTSATGFDFETATQQAITFTFTLAAIPGLSTAAAATLGTSITITDIMDTPQPTIGVFTSTPTIEQNSDFTQGDLGAVAATATSEGGPVGARSFTLASATPGYTINPATGVVNYDGAALPAGTEVSLEITARWEALGLAQAATITTTITFTITAAPLVQHPSTIEVQRAPTYSLTERTPGPVDVGALTATIITEGTPGAITITIASADTHTEDDDWRWQDGQIEYIGTGVDHDDAQEVAITATIQGTATATAQAPTEATEAIDVGIVLVPRQTIITAAQQQTGSITEHTTGLVGAITATALCNTDEPVDVIATEQGPAWDREGFRLDPATLQVFLDPPANIDYNTIQAVDLAVSLTTEATTRCAAADPIVINFRAQILDDVADNQPAQPAGLQTTFDPDAPSLTLTWASVTQWGDDALGQAQRRYNVQFQENAGTLSERAEILATEPTQFVIANPNAGSVYTLVVEAVNSIDVVSPGSIIDAQRIRYPTTITLTATTAAVSLTENTAGTTTPIELSTTLPIPSATSHSSVTDLDSAPVGINVSNPDFAYTIGATGGILAYTGAGIDYETGTIAFDVEITFSIAASTQHLAATSDPLVVSVSVVNDLADNVPTAPRSLTFIDNSALGGIASFSWSPPANWNDVRGTNPRVYLVRIDDSAPAERTGTSLNRLISDPTITPGTTQTFGITARNAYGVSSPETTISFLVRHTPTLTFDETTFTATFAENTQGTPANPLQIATGLPRATLDATSATLGLDITYTLTGTGADRFQLNGANLEYIGGTEDFETTNAYALTLTASVAATTATTAATATAAITITITDAEEPNQTPVRSSLPPPTLTIALSDPPATANIAPLFADPDGDTLTYQLDPPTNPQNFHPQVTLDANTGILTYQIPPNIFSTSTTTWRVRAVDPDGATSPYANIEVVVTASPISIVAFTPPAAMAPGGVFPIVPFSAVFSGFDPATAVFTATTSTPRVSVEVTPTGYRITAVSDGAANIIFRITQNSFILENGFGNTYTVQTPEEPEPDPPTYGQLLGEVAPADTAGNAAIGAGFVEGTDLTAPQIWNLPNVPSTSDRMRRYPATLTQNPTTSAWTFTIAPADATTILASPVTRPRGATLGATGDLWVGDFRVNRATLYNWEEGSPGSITTRHNSGRQIPGTTTVANVRQIYTDATHAWLIPNRTATAQAYLLSDGSRASGFDINIAGVTLNGIAGSGNKLYVYDTTNNRITRWTKGTSSVTQDTDGTFTLTGAFSATTIDLSFWNGYLFTFARDRTATDHIGVYYVGGAD